MTHFEDLVKRMRQAQRNYFNADYKTAHKKEYLIESKELEKQVDRWIKDQELDDAEGSLFE